MSRTAADPNIQTYNSGAVIAHYSSLNYLTACERLLFETCIAEGSTILDLGVGGGRTTGILARRASRYVGADYAAGMVEACRGKFPALEFVVCDASDLSAFSDASFEVVVFAYNGIDFVQPDVARMKCFLHIQRVLKPGGVLIFSSHNPRAVLIRPSWNRERLRQITERVAPRSMHKLVLAILTVLRAVAAFAQAAARSLVRVVRRIPRRTFWRGKGTLVDSAHGGLATHYCVPWRMIAEVELAGLRPVWLVGDDYPARSGAYTTDWYYYVFAKARDL